MLRSTLITEVNRFFTQITMSIRGLKVIYWSFFNHSRRINVFFLFTWAAPLLICLSSFIKWYIFGMAARNPHVFQSHFWLILSTFHVKPISASKWWVSAWISFAIPGLLILDAINASAKFWASVNLLRSHQTHWCLAFSYIAIPRSNGEGLFGVPCCHFSVRHLYKLLNLYFTFKI